MALTLALKRIVSNKSCFVDRFSIGSYLKSLSNVRFCSQFKVEFLGGANKGIAVFRICRPETKNAINRVFIDQLQKAVHSIRFDPKVQVLILKSDVPGAFCSGADLKERAGIPVQEMPLWSHALKQALWDLSMSPVPSIAAIDGAALGGGLELSLACDFRIASTDSKMGLIETKLAIIPGGGGTQRLPRLIGLSKAKELILTGKIISGKEAVDIGLVDYTVEQEEDGEAAYGKALALATEILPQGPIAIRMAKEAISRGYEVDLASGMALESAYYAQTTTTKDRQEAIIAFKDKRKPQFKGE